MKNHSVDILNKIECTGCRVCYQVCPHNAIEMTETKEGFNHPVVDENKCTNCGVCVKKCHALNDNFKMDFKQQIYDVRANDEIRMKSSSGGMFTLAANYVLENNGYVCGASFTDDWLGVEHIIINDKKDLDKLRGSKYIKSDLGNIFIEIKKLLNENKQVLFSGCPCQVSALNSYLDKDYDNLITIDLLCNSIVPQKIWQKYLREKFTDDEIKNIKYVSFRDKEKFGWGAGIYFKLNNNNNNNNNNREYLENNNLYMMLFGNHIAIEDECFKCKYSRLERCSDITIGDFWGTKNPDSKGVSLVFINSIKGNNIFNKVKANAKCKYIKEYTFPNGGLGRINYPIFNSRKYFFDNLDNETLEELYINSKDPKYNVAIVNMMFHLNFGGVLTYYSLFNVIKNLGYNPILIYNNFNNLYDDIKGNKIALKYLNVGNDFFSEEEIKRYIDICDTFLVGSDQVWRYNPYAYNIFYYLLDFVPNNKKKISYSSSFGINEYDGNKEHKLLFKYYLNQFDYVSVREDNGVDICKNEFDVEAYHVLDPVLLLEAKDYDYLISKSKLKIDYNYIAVYDLKKNSILLKLIDLLSEKLNLKCIVINDEDDNYSIEDFLYIIKNSKYFITDSFHGICFSLIFNKPFVSVLNEGPQSRILSISKQFNFEDRVIKNINEITDKKIDNIINMDFTEIDNKLKIEKDKSLNWLIKALETPKKINKDSHKDDMINFLIEKNKELKNKLNNKIEENKNWIRLFGIYNNKNYIYFYIFGIKGVIRATEKNINKIAWWIPVRKWREAFKDKFRKLH